MKLITTDIEGVYILEPEVYDDARGYFFEAFNERTFADITGIATHFVQDNESRSREGVVRGLHFQRAPHAQSKLVRVVSGRALDVAVDLRKESPTYGKWYAVELSEENHRQFYIPRGFAHGFSVLSEQAVFTYKCDNLYHAEAEGGLLLSDPDVAIEWQVPEEMRVISEKDTKHPLFKDLVSPF